MSEIKDPAIKLFGKTIAVPAKKEILCDKGRDSTNGDSLDHDSGCLSSISLDKKSAGGGEQTEEKDQLGGKPSKTKEKNEALPVILVELTDPAMSVGNNENPKTPSADKETAKTKASRTEEEHSDTSSSQEKTTLKKPDKILPCPRCNSMDTKFCYYNNYNVNQPRHFCKNCQRYWTAGGTMRNVPVGAGRRKNKNSASHYRHITVSKTLQKSGTDAPDEIHHPSLKPNGTILTFGSDIPLCESMASAFNHAEKTMQNCTWNGFNWPELRISLSCGGGENGIENFKGSSVSASNSTDEERGVNLQDPMTQNCHGFPPQIQSSPGASWSYPWNSPQWTTAVPPPALCPSNFPISFYPATTYWGCPIPGTWSMPWLNPPSSSPNPGGLGSIPNSTTLGKHSREGDLLKPNNSEKEEASLKQSNSETGVWIPKILRIDDPGEAARSSIWATLGIKNDKSESTGGANLLKAFQSKGDEKIHMVETSQLLLANPAALSRSLDFNEGS